MEEIKNYEDELCKHCLANFYLCLTCNGYFPSKIYNDHTFNCQIAQNALNESRNLITCGDCNNLLNYHDYDNHKLSSCFKREVIVECSICYAKLPKDWLDEHFTKCEELHKYESTIKESQKCEFCHEILPSFIMESHEKSCSKYKKHIELIEEEMKKTKIIYPICWVNKDSKEPSLILLDKTLDDRKFAKKIFKQSVKDAKITNIWRIENNELWEKFYKEKQKIISEKGECKENFLFHGTCNTKPDVICRTGFDISFADDKGYYGRGIYFSRNANYPYKNYSYKSIDNKYYLIIAIVLTGKSKVLARSPFIKKPPFYDQNKFIYFDSVTDIDCDNDNNDTSQIFVVYNNEKAYPYYLIEYVFDNKKKI